MLITNNDERRAFLEGCSIVPDYLLQAWIVRLEDGERGPKAEGLTLRILHDFSYRVMFGIAQSPHTLLWLSECFDRIIDEYKDTREVFVLPKRPKHRPAKAELASNVAIWVRLAQGRGYSVVEAKKKAAEAFHRDRSSIDRLVKQGAGWAEGIVEGARWELFFDGKPGHPRLPHEREAVRKKSRLPARK